MGLLQSTWILLACLLGGGSQDVGHAHVTELHKVLDAATQRAESLTAEVKRLEGELLYAKKLLLRMAEDQPDTPDEPGDRPDDDDEPGDGPRDNPDRGPPVLGDWNPPKVGLDAIPATYSQAPIRTTWSGRQVNVGGDVANVFLEDQTVNKITGSGRWGVAHFRNVEVENELNAKFAVGVTESAPRDILPGETWATSDRATPYGGWLIFENCKFGPIPGAETWQGYGGKMWLHPQGNGSLYMRGCYSAPVREHGVYTEWFKHLHVENCVFDPTGGNAIQSASRGGHGPLADYQHGNPLNTPAGIDGWALIRNVEINEGYDGFRDSSDITFAGFLGPIVIDGVTCNNTISALAVITDAFKGAWVANGTTVPWNQPQLYQSAVDPNPPEGFFSTKELWVNELKVTWDADNGRRGMVLLSGIGESHFGTFDIGGNMPAIIVNNEYGGPFPCGPVYFHDQASVDAHFGRIGWFDPNGGSDGKGGFRAFSKQILADGIVMPEELVH